MDKINKMASGQVPFNGADVYDKLDELVEGYNEITLKNKILYKKINELYDEIYKLKRERRDEPN